VATTDSTLADSLSRSVGERYSRIRAPTAARNEGSASRFAAVRGREYENVGEANTNGTDHGTWQRAAVAKMGSRPRNSLELADRVLPHPTLETAG
jgi:hypothetical protein